MLERFERNISILGRSLRTFDNYSRHIAAMALHFGCLPTELDEEQIKDYLYELQQRSKTPSQTYFKHTVYGLRFMLKGEGLPYSHLHLPSIKKEKKLPTVLSKAEVWRMLKTAALLKQKILIGLLYSCGLRCMEVRSVRLKDLDFDRKMLHVVQSKGRKDRYVPLSDHLIRGLKKYISAERPAEWLFNGKPGERAGGDFDNRYSQRGVQWAVSRIAKDAGITKEVSVHTLRHTYACHLLEEGMNIVTLKELMGHANIEATMEYLHICQLDDRKMFSPLDSPMRPRCEVADVLQRLGSQREQMGLNGHQLRTLRAIEMCRTPMLGGHVDACDAFGHISISYNSCRNRHCPKCLGHKREEWIRQREQDLLPCTYYHVVFTLPQQLGPLALRQPALIYDALFKSVWHTLQQFGRTAGIQLGMIAVLHTWGQNLSLHPHLHCIVPGGGVGTDGRWQKQVRSNKYLFSVKALSKVFRAKYVQHLREKGIEDKALLESLFQKDWVAYAKRPFGGPAQVIEYLGRYTHKVAISNHRLQEVTDTDVLFTYKDYRESEKNKTMSLSHREFVRRFAQHILPLRFVRIRHYGMLSSTWKRGKLQALQSELKVKRPEGKNKNFTQKMSLLQNRHIDND